MFLTTPFRMRPSASASAASLRLTSATSSRIAFRERTMFPRLRSRPTTRNSQLAPLQDVEVLQRPRVGNRTGKEGTDPDVDREASLDPLEDAPLDGGAGLERLLDGVPRLVPPCALVREDDVAALALGLLENRLDLVAGVRELVRGDARELVAGDHPLRFESDVDEDLVVRDLDDPPPDELALLERAFALGQQPRELAAFRELIGLRPGILLGVVGRHQQSAPSASRFRTD